MGTKDATNNVLNWAWKILSILVIPTMVWAASLNSTVNVQATKIEALEISSAKHDETLITIARMDERLKSIQRIVEEIKVELGDK